MQQQDITIWDKNVRIQFMHNKTGQSEFIVIPADELERIVTKWAKKQSGAESAEAKTEKE